MKTKIAITHPGKMGDAIYSLPVIRWLCKKHNTQSDFWTSPYCAPLKELFEYQSCIDKFHVNQSYVMHHWGMGVQPWHIEIPEQEYIQVYHLGFRNHPFFPLTDYMASLVDAPMGLPIQYEYPNIPTLDEKYVIVAPRGEPQWIPFIENVSKFIQVVQIGGPNDKVSNIGINKTGLNFLETLPWIANSKAFYGCLSSQLVLAYGFPIPKQSGVVSIQTVINETDEKMQVKKAKIKDLLNKLFNQ